MLVALGTAAALATAGWEAFGRGDFDARFNVRLATLPNVSPVDLNDRAWMIAVSPDSTFKEMESALALAERAVAETKHRNPSILDTLAEVQFQLGQPELAIVTIMEAIMRDPEQPYYREQLRRFSGERDAEDRPEYDPFKRQPRERLIQREPGLTV